MPLFNLHSLQSWLLSSVPAVLLVHSKNWRPIWSHCNFHNCLTFAAKLCILDTYKLPPDAIAIHQIACIIPKKFRRCYPQSNWLGLQTQDPRPPSGIDKMGRWQPYINRIIIQICHQKFNQLFIWTMLHPSIKFHYNPSKKFLDPHLDPYPNLIVGSLATRTRRR